MDKNELERRLEAAEKQNLGLLDEIKNLKAQLADMQEPEIPDMPYFSSGERWWYVETEGSLIESDSIRDGKRSEFNSFHSKEYADEFAKKCKLIAMMLHCKWYLCSDFSPEWSKDAPEKYVIYYSHEENKFKVDDTYMVEENDVCFDTEENAQKCADWLNEHWRGCDD